MPNIRQSKVINRTVTRAPRNGKDPFFGMEVVSTSVNSQTLKAIEDVISKCGMNRSEFIRNAVIRELAYHKFCNFHGTNPLTYPMVGEKNTSVDVEAAVAEAKSKVLDDVSKMLIKFTTQK